MVIKPLELIVDFNGLALLKFEWIIKVNFGN